MTFLSCGSRLLARDLVVSGHWCPLGLDFQVWAASVRGEKKTWFQMFLSELKDRLIWGLKQPWVGFFMWPVACCLVVRGSGLMSRDWRFESHFWCVVQTPHSHMVKYKNICLVLYCLCMRTILVFIGWFVFSPFQTQMFLWNLLTNYKFTVSIELGVN